VLLICNPSVVVNLIWNMQSHTKDWFLLFFKMSLHCYTQLVTNDW
jgi:hypothetical protein